MISAIRRRLGPGDRERGTNLTELNVTMIVLSVVVTATVSLIIGFQRTNASNVSRQEQIDSARSSVEAMSKAIRTAVKPAQISATCTLTSCPQDAFLIGADNAVQFYANLNNEGGSVGPSRVSYSVPTSGADAGRLIETIQQPDSNEPGPTGFTYCDATAASATSACRSRYSTRVLATGVQLDAGSPIFKYYSRTARVLPSDFGGTLSGSEMTGVVAVEIVLSVQAPNATTAEPTQYIQRVMLPNVQAVIRQEEETA